MLLVVGVIVAVGAGVAWAVSRTPATSSSDQEKGGTTIVNVHQAPPTSQPAPQPQGGKKGGGDPLGGLGLLGAAGAIGGKVGEALAFTNVGKATALPVGLGVAAAAYLATSVGGAAAAGGLVGLAAAAVWAIPVFLVTTSIVALIDNITRAAQSDQWRKTAAAIRDMRAAGQFREAMELYSRMAGTRVRTEEGKWIMAGGELSEIALVDPRPGEEWWNPLDPLGRPYPGFPGPPAPASLADVIANPSLIPTTLNTTDGKSCNVRDFMAAAESDVAVVRAWGLANGIPGEVPGGAATRTEAATGKVIAATGVAPPVTSGPRSLANWPELKKRLDNLSTLRASILQAVPWVSALPFVTPGFDPYTAEDRAVFAAKSAAARVEAQRREGVADKREATRTGMTVVAVRTMRGEAKADAAADRADAVQSRAQGTEAAAGSRSGTSSEAGDRASERGTGPRATGGGRS